MAYGISLDDFNRLTPSEIYRIINLKHRLRDTIVNQISSMLHGYIAYIGTAIYKPDMYLKKYFRYETYELTDEEKVERHKKEIEQLFKDGEENCRKTDEARVLMGDIGK